MGEFSLDLQLRHAQSCLKEYGEKLERAEKRNAVLVQQLAKATRILQDVHLISPGQPGHGDLSREQRTLADVARFIKEVE